MTGRHRIPLVILFVAGTLVCGRQAPAGAEAPAMKAPIAPPPSTLVLPQKGRFLGMQQAVEVALAKHPFVQEADATMKAATARTEQTRSLYLPQVYANVDTSSGAGRINPRFVAPAGAMLQPNLSSYAAGVTASQRLYDFGFTRDLVESFHLAERAQEQDIEARRAIVMLNVQRAYYVSLKRRRLVQIAEDTVRERGIIKNQIEALYKQQLKSKLDLDLVQVELTNAESLLVKARNDFKAGFADLNRAMGIPGEDDYILEDIAVQPRVQRALESLIGDSLSHPEFKRAKELTASAQQRMEAVKKQYLPTVNAFVSGGDYDVYDDRRRVNSGGWWSATATISMPLFTGFYIENQVREAKAQRDAAEARTLDVQQALSQQVTNSYLETLTQTQQIKLSEEQVKTAQEALNLSKQRYKLGLGSVVEVTQSEVALTSAQTKLAEAQYDYKIAEVTLAYATGVLRTGEQ